MLGFYRNNGQENGNYYLGFTVQVLGFRGNVDPCLVNPLLIIEIILGIMEIKLKLLYYRGIIVGLYSPE